MDDDDEFVLIDELRACRERLRRVVGVDGFDIDLISWSVERIEKLEKILGELCDMSHITPNVEIWREAHSILEGKKI